MRRGILLAAMLAGAGCSRGPEKPVQAESAAAKPPAGGDSRAVTLDAKAQKEAGLQMAEVARKAVPQTVRATGRLVNNENTTWRVGAVTEGRILHAIAKVGDLVKEGQILADMHSHDIHEARALHLKAMADLSRAQANEAFAQKNRDRMRRLFEMKAASQEQVEASENETKNAATGVRNAEVEVERTKKHLTEFLDIPEISQKDEDDHIPVRAPATGVVLQRNVTPGSVVTPSTDMYIISDLSTIWAIASVQEENLPKLRVGMPARVFVQAYGGQPFYGRVGKIGEVLDAATRTVSVRVELKNADGRLKPEMYASVDLDFGGSEEALFVPESAPQDVNGQTVLFVWKGGDQFEVRPVELGRAIEGQSQVVRGLRPGESVVGRGSFILKSQLLKASLSEE